MKKIAIVMLVVMLFSVMLSMASCGCGATRYTITEEEWDNLSKTMENCTIEGETYIPEHGQSSVKIKQADGIYCYCDYYQNYNGDDANHSNTSSTAVVSSTDTKGQAKARTVDTYAGSAYGSSVGSDYGSSTGSAYGSSTGSTYGSSIGSTYGSSIASDYEITINSSYNTIFSPSYSFGYTIVTQYPIGGDLDFEVIKPGIDNDIFKDYYAQYFYIGTYFDSDGNEYVNNNLDNSIYGVYCYKNYNDENYIEILVEDENGKEVTKWTKDRGNFPASKDTMEKIVEYEDLEYDEKEKAYIYQYTIEGTTVKGYLYFENGKLMKAVSFSTYEEDEGETVDISKLTPKDVGGDGYISVVSTYSDYGTTKVDHKFDPKDIVTRKVD